MGKRKQSSSTTRQVFSSIARLEKLHLQRVWRFAAASLTSIALVASLFGPGAGLASAAPVQRPASRVPACAKSYEVVSGDYWIKIASKTGVTTSALYTANNASATTPLYPGAQICLPDSATAPTTPTTVPAAPLPEGSVQLAAFPAQGPCNFTDTWQTSRGGGRLHEGVDLIAKSGQYVYAVADGRLSKQSVDKPGSLSGNAWWLTAVDGTYYFYAHLSAFAPEVKLGSKVTAGQIIGFVGSTGNAGVSHLHFEVHPKGGVAVNPTPIVKAINGCKTSAPPPQPNGSAPAAPPPTTAPATAPPPAPVPPPATPAPPPVVLPTAAAPVSTQPGSLWQFVSPMTAFDSASSGRLAGGVPQTIRVNRLYGVPSATAGLIVRLTASDAASAGYLVTHACDIAAPVASTLTLYPNRTSVGTASVRVASGNVCVTASTSVRLKVEVIAAQAATGAGLQPVSAARAVDTRATTRLVPGATLSLSPAALSATPGTQALSASITVVDPAAAGMLSIGFCGQGGWKVPITSDPVSSFAVTMRVNNSGWCITSSVATDVIVDVVGNWTTGATLLGAIDPVRVYDSRSAGGPIGIGAVGVQINGLGGVPADATVAMLSVTTVTGGRGSSVFLVPCGEGRSAGTVIASTAYRVATAVVPVRLGGGAVCISSFHAVDVIIDVVGAG